MTTIQATEHLRRSGDAICRLVAGLSAADLSAGEGSVRHLAEIAARHADDHRADIEAAQAARGLWRGLRLAPRLPAGSAASGRLRGFLSARHTAQVTASRLSSTVLE